MTSPLLRFTPGRVYTFGPKLCALFHRAGWKHTDVSPTVRMRAVSIILLDQPLPAPNSPAPLLFTDDEYEAKFTDDRTGRDWYIMNNWWHEVFEVALTLAEKERARMAAEPWVAKRDANLRDMFKPK